MTLRSSPQGEVTLLARKRKVHAPQDCGSIVVKHDVSTCFYLCLLASVSPILNSRSRRSRRLCFCEQRCYNDGNGTERNYSTFLKHRRLARTLLTHGNAAVKSSATSREFEIDNVDDPDFLSLEAGEVDVGLASETKKKVLDVHMSSDSEMGTYNRSVNPNNPNNPNDPNNSCRNSDNTNSESPVSNASQRPGMSTASSTDIEAEADISSDGSDGSSNNDDDDAVVLFDDASDQVLLYSGANINIYELAEILNSPKQSAKGQKLFLVV